MRNTEPIKTRLAKYAMLVCALGMCVCVAVFVNNAIGYIPLVALLAVVGISYAYLQVLKRSLVYSEQSLIPSCERGSDIDFVLYFENTSPLVFVRLEPYIYISDIFDNVDVVTPTSMVLMPHEKRDFTFDARFDHIGTYAAGVKKIVIGDLLGLFSCTIENPERHRVDVLPRLFSVERLEFSNESSQDAQRAMQALVTDDMDYAGVREYVWGDAIKTIHWKLSARMTEGDYLTRLFETFTNPGVDIILDTHAPSYDAESLMFVYDGIVESALSVNDFARERGLDSAIIFTDRYGERAYLGVTGRTDFAKLTARLPRIDIADDREGLDLLKRESGQIHGKNNVVFCTAHVSEGLVSALISLKTNKRNPMLMVTVPPAMEKNDMLDFTRPLRRLDTAGIVYYVISSAEDLGSKGEED